MSYRPHLPSVLILSSLAVAVSAGELPAAPTELGSIRRNERGQLEVFKAPAETPPGATATTVVPETVKRAAPGQPPAQKAPAAVASGRTIVVGPLEPVSSIQEAARIARDGDTVEIRSGEYRQQAVVWTQARLTIRGVGQRPVLIADGDSAEGKALWVVRNADMLIENIEFRGARVPDGNGAAIRFENGHLRVVRCAFFDNEMGILSGNLADAVLEVVDSEFGQAPTHAGALHHLLYAGSIARLSVRGSRFQQGFRGHLIKSRARQSDIRYNLIVDGAEGRASYELEFPNGGLVWVIGNVIGQSAQTENPDIVSYGAEGQRWPENALYLVHNTLVDQSPGGRFLHLWLEKLPPGAEVWALNNLLVGLGTFAPQAPGRYDGNVIVDRSALSDRDGLPFALPSNSLLRGKASSPGFVGEQSLTPSAEFRLPAGSRPLPAGKPLSPGALQ
ncbi:hypothetical protein [Accumulibacter sp.]|uniref:hypothetical protein n=1 Tax=Accumulibacter sp. TaxID=2053492 RepID=UPI002600455E|nr:hypothetical protein [Accumulibacter sp.]